MRKLTQCKPGFAPLCHALPLPPPPSRLFDGQFVIYSYCIRHSDIFPPSAHKMGWGGGGAGKAPRMDLLFPFALLLCGFSLWGLQFLMHHFMFLMVYNREVSTIIRKQKILTGNYCLNESKERYGHFSRKLTALYSNIHTLKQEIMIILIKSIMSYCRPINTWSFLLTTPVLGIVNRTPMKNTMHRKYCTYNSRKMRNVLKSQPGRPEIVKNNKLCEVWPTHSFKFK